MISLFWQPHKAGPEAQPQPQPLKASPKDQPQPKPLQSQWVAATEVAVRHIKWL